VPTVSVFEVREIPKNNSGIPQRCKLYVKDSQKGKKANKAQLIGFQVFGIQEISV
jgi:hypothetical protein